MASSRAYMNCEAGCRTCTRPEHEKLVSICKQIKQGNDYKRNLEGWTARSLKRTALKMGKLELREISFRVKLTFNHDKTCNYVPLAPSLAKRRTSWWYSAVTRGHRNWYHSTTCLQFPISDYFVCEMPSWWDINSLVVCRAVLHRRVAACHGLAERLLVLVSHTRRCVDARRHGDAPASRSAAAVAHSRPYMSLVYSQLVYIDVA